jgi:hypothetical protein
MIECKLCHNMFLTLNTHLERTHNVKISDYKNKFGNDTPLYSDETKKKQSKNATSPFMIRHWINKGYSENQAKELVKPYLDKNAENARIYSPRCVEHWLGKGYTNKEAIDAVSEYQTRDLKFYQNKYGDLSGLLKFNKIMESLHYSNTSEFLYSLGMDDKDIRKYKDHASLSYFTGLLGDEEGLRVYEEKCKSHRKYSPRCIEYWKRLGFDDNESIDLLSHFQTRNLETFIQKYGKELGLIKYSNWVKDSQTKRNGNISKESILYFKPLLEYCDNNSIPYEGEYRIERETGRNFYYDMAIPSLNLIFEYDGCMFHADALNPDYDWIGRHGLTYKESLDRDAEKQRHAELFGFKVIRVYSKRKKDFDLIQIIKENYNV